MLMLLLQSNPTHLSFHSWDCCILLHPTYFSHSPLSTFLWRICTLLVLVTPHVSNTTSPGRYYLEMIMQCKGRSESDSYPTAAPCLTSFHQSSFSNTSSEIPKYETVGSAVRTGPLSNPLNRALQLNQISLSIWSAFSLRDFLTMCNSPSS